MVKLFSFGSNKSKVNKDEVVKSINYTDEFPYLPSYFVLKAAKFIPATPERPLAEAEYIIRIRHDTQVYENYRATLIEDGWKISDEMPVTKFTAEKDTHIAYIMISRLSDTEDILLRINSK
ncbi:hypothetical protein ACPUYX_00270 [Desulfosporosinus sp. SYSU MS00001]|uniref:hypothetical protein n=1 Tax=Desulfosporosinus sp. SYSU MS00001 TaxID=3416284 RepID=UPI003CF4D051